MKFSRFIALSLTALALLSRGVVAQDGRRDIFVETDHCDCRADVGSSVCADVSPDRFDECAPDLFIRIDRNPQHDFECEENLFSCTYEDIPIDDRCFDVQVWDLDPNSSDEGESRENANNLGEVRVCFDDQQTEWVLDDPRNRGRTTLIRVIFIPFTAPPTTTTTQETAPPTTMTTIDGVVTAAPTVVGGTPAPGTPAPAPTPSETGAAAVEDLNDVNGSINGAAAALGPTIGGVVGGVCAILLAFCLFCMWRRKRNNKKPKQMRLASSSSLAEVTISDPIDKDAPSAQVAETPSVKKGGRNSSGTVSLSSVRTASTSSGSIPLKQRTETLELKTSIPEKDETILPRPDQPNLPPPPPPVSLAGASKSSRRQLFQAQTSHEELVASSLARERITNAQMKEMWNSTVSGDKAPESDVRKVASKVIDEMNTRVVSLLKNFKQIDHDVAQGFFEECHKRPVDRLVASLKKETPLSKQFSYFQFENATNKVLLTHMERGVSTLILQTTDVGTKHR